MPRTEETGYGETPPRTWGRPDNSALNAHHAGNTPTHVGKTQDENDPDLNPKKHPHARGEDRPNSSTCSLIMETPPRTWGRPISTVSACGYDRNTPTHVGKTSLPCTNIPALWKHPHARGEDHITGLIAGGVIETPPRTWGRRQRHHRLLL